MNCTYCEDTGSLSKDIDGHLDCPHCGVAQERIDLECWVTNTGWGVLIDHTTIWMIYLHGKQSVQTKEK